MKRSLLPIFLIVLVDVFGFTLVFPLQAIYAERFGASPLQATLLVSVYALCQLFAGPLLGQWSDRIGRRPVLLLSQCGTFLGFVAMAQATSLWMLYAARALDGITAGNLAVAQAYISDHTEPAERAQSFAVIGIAFGLGFFLGPFVTGQLATIDLRAPIYLAAGLALVSILCTLWLLPAATPAAGSPVGPAGRRMAVWQWASYLHYFRRPRLGRLLLQFFCYVMAFSTFSSGFALFAERTFSWRGEPFGSREVGYVFAYTGLLGAALQGGLMGRLVRRFGEAPLVVAGFAALAVAYAALGLIHAPFALLAVATLATFGNGVIRPVLTSLISQRAEPHEVGQVLGLNTSLGSIANVLAPPLGGLLLSWGNLSGWAWLAGLGALAGLVMAWPRARADEPTLGYPQDLR